MAFELDYMEYINDEAAQAAYVSSAFDEDTTIISQLIENYQGNIGGEVDFQLGKAQGITLSGTEPIIGIGIKFGATQGSPSGQITCRIENDNIGKPSGILAHPNAIKTFTPTQNSWNDVIFASSFSLVAGSYHIVLVCVDNQDNYNYWTWRGTTADVYAGGGKSYSKDKGTTWTPEPSGMDMAFRVYGISYTLQCYSEPIIKTQGSYSLKVIAKQTDSLNETLTKSGLSIDLTDKNTLKLDVRASRIGTNLQTRFYDSVGGWITKDINITSADLFQEVIMDISGVDNSNKSNITKIEFKILNADSETTYYIDNFSIITLKLVDIDNDFRTTKFWALTNIDNDFRNRIETVININNKFNTLGQKIYDVINNFRSRLTKLTDIVNKINILGLRLYNTNNKFNFVIRLKSNIVNYFASSIVRESNINNNICTYKLQINNINNDFRMLDRPDTGIQAIGKSAFTVKINGIDKTNILDLDSLNWKETLNSSSTASFVLAVPYDSGSCPSENQTVEILFSNRRKFYGYITNIAKISNPEGIQITAEDEYRNLNKTEVDFKVGRKLAGDPVPYYATINQALSACGFSVGIGNFIPVTINLVGSKADVISQLVQQSGNFGWFINPAGIKKLWQPNKGDIVNLEKQVIGKNLDLYQVIEHNILKDSSGIVNKFKVTMGEDIVPGYNNEFRFAYISQSYEQYDSGWMDFYRNNQAFPEYYRNYPSSIQWYDKRRTTADTHEAVINIPSIGNGFKITVPSGIIKGYPLQYKNQNDIGVTWEFDKLAENTKVLYGNVFWFNRGGIYPEGRRERTFEVSMGDYPQIIAKDLVLSNLNVQYGINYKVWEGHNWSYSIQQREWRKIEKPPEDVYYTLNKTGAYITQKSYKIASWNDISYATDYANWLLSKNCDIKEGGTITITMDCADYYSLDLSKRINISGITSKPLNIVSISYDVSSYKVTITVESMRDFKRTVSIPVHMREE